jgi:hypothetical protein
MPGGSRRRWSAGLPVVPSAEGFAQALNPPDGRVRRSAQL